jgi:PilZ domain
MFDRRQIQRRAADAGLLGRRRAPRAEIALPASINTVTGRRTVDLHNLSCTGAMIEGSPLPTVGADIVIKCGEVDVFGIVIWARPGKCGVAFDQPITQQDVVRLRGSGQETARTGITPDEHQAAQDWAHGRGR